MAGKPFSLWPHGAPGAIGAEPDDVPTLTPYLPSGPNRTDAAVIVCPGGGYVNLAAHEAGPIAEWLNTLGITGFVLRYRRSPRYKHPSPLLDAQRAVRTVRSRAAEWQLDPQRIGILGFSAGGHLAATAGTHFDAGDAQAADAVERASSRPDFMVLVYAVISFGRYGHAGSCRNLLGEAPAPEMIWSLSNELQVTPRTPPAFLVHSIEDAGVPCENSVLFATALRHAGVPFELHLMEKGRHGLGLDGGEPAWATWPAICAEWLRRR